MSEAHRDRRRWGAVPVALLEDQTVGYRALKVFTVLSAMQGRRRHVQATLGAIALQAHVDERDTRRALALLQTRGWLRRLEAPGKASVFEVLMARAGPQGEGRITPGSEGTPGRMTPGRNTPPSSSPNPPLPPDLRDSEQEAEEEHPPAPPIVTPAPDAYTRWRLRLASEVGSAVLDKPKTRAAWDRLVARGLDGAEALAYALAEWSELTEPRRVGHLVQAMLDGDHLEQWLARRARRKARRQQEADQLELSGPDLAFTPIPEGDWMAVVHARRKAGAGGAG